MKKINLLLSTLVAVLFAFNVNSNHLTENLLITAKLDGSQEIPAVVTNALGIASCMINATRDTICLNIGITGLSGPLTGVHIHEGEPGVSGNVFKDLTSFAVGNRIATMLTGADVSTEIISKFLSGKFYVNVHTAANPDGEIRGQLSLETDWSFALSMDGAQEVPAVLTTAYGVGVFNLSKDLSKINFNVTVQELSGTITGAHLHYGALGVSGNVAIDLSSNINGNVISGTISSPIQMLIDSLMASKIYFNVHTTANVNGEIRGQLLNYKKYLYFDASLDGNQEVPPVLTSAKASATIKLNATYDTLWYDVAADSLSGIISGAHFHNALPGIDGIVELDLTSDIAGNRIMGNITGSMLTTNFINKILRGEIYINLHTAAYPNGEIRGQVYRLAREGYTFSLEGSQEVPAVSSSATGSGIVSIDRDHDNAHFMFVSSGLTSTGVHFHKGIMGQAGDVLYDLTSTYINNGAWGFWKSSDVIPFTLSNSIQFSNDSVYLNVHTSANPDGEIRGQVWRGFKCFDNNLTSIEKDIFPIEGINIYPNPISDVLNVRVFSGKNSTLKMTVISALGKQVYSGNFILNRGNNNFSIDLSMLESQMYFVQILDDNNQVVQKFIKN